MFGQPYRERRLTVRCAKCNRPCERYEVTPRSDSMSWRVVVWCHGDRDEMVLTTAFLQEASSGIIAEGLAFQTERLTHG